MPEIDGITLTSKVIEANILTTVIVMSAYGSLSDAKKALNAGAYDYIIKVKDGNHIYYVANSTDSSVNTSFRVRGDLQLQIWNPHDGSLEKATTKNMVMNGQICTQVSLHLEPVQSIFFVEK